MNRHTTPHIRLCPGRPEIEVLYDDASLLVLNKPAGPRVDPDPHDPEQENLMDLLRAAIRDRRAWAVQRKLTYLAGAHRIEAAASGVLILARSPSVLTGLAEQFHAHPPRITWTAVVQGTFPAKPVEVTLPLAPDPFKPDCLVVDKGRGRPATTRFEPLERFRGYALVQAEAAAGRLHQIRAHLKAIGCPLAADPLYGNGRPLLLSQLKKDYKLKPEGERPLLDRPALHAGRFELKHPVSGEALILEAPWPKDLAVAVKYLRRFAV